ncbi:hypothetical protein, partial [Streptococcus pneumoniae]|uniref:hypothetical protein n=1 Tax=Streptococcus pneumoniae TaxID=1313 RepID=UPI0012D717CC
MTQNGCTSLSGCHYVFVPVGTSDLNTLPVTVSPSPARDLITLRGAYTVGINRSYQLADLSGRTLLA